MEITNKETYLDVYKFWFASSVAVKFLIVFK